MSRLSTLLISFFCAFTNVFGGEIVVDSSGGGHFRTVQQAIDSVRAFDPAGWVTIFVRNGTYREKLEIHTHTCRVRLVGQSVDKTIITYDDHANINKMGTFRTYTLLVRGDDILIENITIRNDAEPIGQAVALHLEGDRVVVRGCRILGNQDTIYTGRPNARHYFEGCYIEGTTDFIFGPSTCWFERCVLFCKRDSYITAASTPANTLFGYVFNNCTIEVAQGVKSLYLGRPWRAHAMTLFMNCSMDQAVRAEGWHNWGKVDNELTARYLEYNNRGGGADVSCRVKWSRVLTARESRPYTIQNVMRGSDGWNPLLVE